MKRTIKEYAMKLPEQIWTHEQIVAAENLLRQLAEDMREECAKVCKRIAKGDMHGNSDWCSPSCHGEDASTIRSIEIK